MPDFVAGEIVTANKMNQIPKGVLGYAFRTSNISGLSGGPVDLTGLSVQVSVPAGRLVRVVGHVWAWTGPTQGETADFLIREGNTQLNKKRLIAATTTGTTEGGPVEALIRPSAGTHTYKLSFEQISGSSNWTLAASANGPAYIVVEDLGADPNA